MRVILSITAPQLRPKGDHPTVACGLREAYLNAPGALQRLPVLPVSLVNYFQLSLEGGVHLGKPDKGDGPLLEEERLNRPWWITLKVAAAQIRPRFARPEENRALTRRYCLRAARRGVELLVFPELCITGYNFSSRKQLEPLAEPVPEGPTTQLWMELAREHGMVIVGGLAERDGQGHIYNSAVAVGPEGYLGCYRKLHLFGREKELFEAGDRPLRVIRLPGVALGVLICFDWAFPEAARVLMLEGCEVLCHPANLVLPLAQRVMVARSIENRIFTITANRVGSEGDLTFTGRSQITNCQGDLLVRGSPTRPQLLIADINPAEARDKHLTPSNHIILDRRPAFYRRILEP